MKRQLGSVALAVALAAGSASWLGCGESTGMPTEATLVKTDPADNRVPAVLLLDIGTQTTDLVAYGAKGPIAARVLRRGGAHVTRALQEHYRLDAAAAERAKIEADMLAVEKRIEADMDPYVSARQMDTDEIVELGELRGYLAALVEMSYQNTGYRRIKNPRIWTMHDLAVLTGGIR